MAVRLGAATREARRAAGLRLLDIAHAAGVSESTVSRFERGERWPKNAHQLVAVYARELAITEDELWAAAIATSHPGPTS